MLALGGRKEAWACPICPLLRSLSGVKQTWVGAPHMSANNPKRTFDGPRSRIPLRASEYFSRRDEQVDQGPSGLLRCSPSKKGTSVIVLRGGTHVSSTDFTIFVISDPATSTSGLTKRLRSAGYNAKTYCSPDEFLDEHDWTQPGCVLLDLCMKDAFQVQRQLAGRILERPIVFLAARCTVEECVQAMKAGAVDFFSKPVRPQKLLEAIEQAKVRDDRIRFAAAKLKEIAALEHRLSPREKEVLCHVVAGWQNLQIANALGIGLNTVKVHRGRVMEKMRVRSVADLVRLTAKMGLQPAGAPERHKQTIKVQRQLAKGAPKNKLQRQIIAKSASGRSDFSEPRSALRDRSSCSSMKRQRYAYGPICGLPSIRSAVR
jgi:FixJ family two-component response regulator